MKKELFKRFILLFTVCMTLIMGGCVDAKDVNATVDSQLPPEPTARPTDTVSFIAAGDNLIHGSIYLQAKNRSANGTYDFDYVYQNTEDYFKSFDVRFINQETIVNSAFPPSTYPQFSTPVEMGDKIVSMGFNVVGTSNNHSYDMGATGVYSSLEYWNSQPVVNMGFYTGDDSKDIKYLTKNNITMAFLAYTYGTNGLNISDPNCPKVINIEDFDTIERQVNIAKANADVVIVSCHWGYEDTNEINDLQREVARTHMLYKLLNGIQMMLTIIKPLFAIPWEILSPHNLKLII